MEKMIKRLLALAVLASSPALLAETLSAEQIVEKSNLAAVYPSTDGRAEARMTIVDKQGRRQIRQFSMLRRNLDGGGEQQYLVVFTRPNDVARTSFLVHKKPGADDDRWLYLPGLDLVRRIAAGDKRTSFVGSTFFYEDISGRDIALDSYQLLGQTDEHWLIRATPKSTAGVEFEHYTVKIAKANYLPLVAEYFDGRDQPYRRITAEDIRDVDGVPTIVQMKAENIRDGSFTVNQMRNIQYDIGIPATVFSENSLRMPPRQWLEF